MSNGLKIGLKVSGRHTITGLRTDCFTEKVSEVELNYHVKLGVLFKLWFYIEPGVTGYESFEFSHDTNMRVRETGWSACAGTAKSWDKLFIPAVEMELAISDIEEQLLA